MNSFLQLAGRGIVQQCPNLSCTLQHLFRFFKENAEVAGFSGILTNKEAFNPGNWS